jgi:hypothetical protein
MLAVAVEGDGFAEFAREAFHVVIHGGAPLAVEVDGQHLDSTPSMQQADSSSQARDVAFDYGEAWLSTQGDGLNVVQCGEIEPLTTRRMPG